MASFMRRFSMIMIGLGFAVMGWLTLFVAGASYAPNNGPALVPWLAVFGCLLSYIGPMMLYVGLRGPADNEKGPTPT